MSEPDEPPADELPEDELVEQLVEDALESGGLVGLDALAERFVPVADLRALAKQHGLSPKGFRVEKAPADVLAALLAGAGEAEVLEQLVRAVLAGTGAAEPAPAEPAADGGAQAQAQAQMLRLKEQENAQLRDQLERAHQGLARHRELESELGRRNELADAEVTRLRNEAQALRAARPAGRDGTAEVAALASRVHDLERERDQLAQGEEQQRRLLAEQRARVRALEEHVAELEALVPKGRRRKEPPPEQPKLKDAFRLPHFLPSFYRSLEDKDRRQIGKAMQAALLFCTEGPSYPGLEVKQLEGVDLWSLRASLKLRVYFRLRADGDVDFVALADREDQNTMLRRLKEQRT
jgi:hypothetical protein